MSLPRLVLSVCAMTLTALVLTTTPALAAAPETPELKLLSPVSAGAALAEGVLNPKAAGEVGEYEFLYKKVSNGAGCTGEGVIGPFVSVGSEAEHVGPETIGGLEGNTEYTVCLRANNLAAESAESAPATFKTALTPEAPLTREAKSITGATAVLRGELNPGAKAGDPVTEEYQFDYAPSASQCTGAAVAPEPAAVAAGSPREGVETTVTGLEGSTEYAFCVVAINKNQLGSIEGRESQIAPPLTFRTSAVAPKVDAESVSAQTPFVATLEAQVNPENQRSTSCVFEYGETAAYGTTAACAPPTVEGSSDQGVSAAVSALTPSKTYHYRVVVGNATGTARGADEEFKTPAAQAPTVENVFASSVTPFTATLLAEVNPEFQTSTCEVEYGKVVSEHKEPCAPATVEGSVNHGISLRVKGLEPGTTYHIRVLAENTSHEKGESTGEFTTLSKEPPKVENVHASSLAPFTATLEAEVNPEFQTSTCEVEYGKVVSEHKSPCVPATVEGSGNQGISLPVKGLEPGTTYHIRVLAENTSHEKGESTGEFTTLSKEPPKVENVHASSLAPFTATLEAEVNPEFQTSTCEVEYGKVVSEHKSPCVPATVEGSGNQGISLPVKGLEPGTTYHIRVLAENTSHEKGESTGEFTTETTKAPVIEGESVSAVTAIDAQLHAQI